MNVEKRLKELFDLPDGWHFGEGVKITEKAQTVTNFILHYRKVPKYNIAEVFPRVDGGIRVCFYEGDLYLEFDVTPDGSIDFRKEFNNVLLEEVENVVKFGDAVELLDKHL